MALAKERVPAGPADQVTLAYFHPSDKQKEIPEEILSLS